MNDDAHPPHPPQSPDVQASHSQPNRTGRVRLFITIAAVISLAALVGIFIIRPAPFFSRSASLGPSSTPAGRPAPPDKQILRVTEAETQSGLDLNSIDPALAGTRDAVKAQLVFPELITLDDSGKPLDWAAKSYEVSSDGLTWTFHLRPGMKWSDGTAIDANTFVYSINRALDPCLASGVAGYLFNIKGASDFYSATCPTTTVNGLSGNALDSVKAPDAQTLKLTLEAPAAYFLGAFSLGNAAAVPKQLIDKYAEKWTDHLADGTGFGGNLYKVVLWDHAGHFALAANSAFWGPQPILQKVEWTLYQSLDTAWADYRVGVGDIGFPPVDGLSSARTLAGYHEVPTLSVRYLRVNWALAPFDDVRVRNAFSLAIDRKAIATAIYNSTVIPTIHTIPQGIPGYNPNLKNAAGDSGDKALTPNIAKAQELAKAYAADKCSGDYSKCPSVVITFAVSKPDTYLLAQVLQQEWQTAFPGWRITLQGVTLDLIYKTLIAMQLTDATGWSADYPDPQDVTSLLWAKDAPYNQSSVDVPEADALMQQADVSTDRADRLALYQHAEQLLIDQGAFIALDQGVFSWIVRPSSKLMKWNVNSFGNTALSTWQQAYISV
jgi:oligopeptide transport system substrate-binding protein